MVDSPWLTLFKSAAIKGRMTRWLPWTVGFALCLVSLAGASPPALQGPRLSELSGGPFDRPASVVWSHAPLRKTLENLGRAHRISIVLDRRIDPGQELTYTADDRLSGLLEGIAKQLGLGVSRIGDVVYLGPPATARKLRTLAALRRSELDKLPAERRKRLLGGRPWRWPALTTPRELVEQLGGQAGLSIANLDSIPHDLWPAVDLPNLAWIDRATLVVAQFDLTFELMPGGEAARLVPIPDHVSIRRTFTAEGGRGAAIAKRLRSHAPAAKVEWIGGKLTIDGHAEDVELAARLVHGDVPTSTKATNREVRHKLTVKNVPLRSVLDQLATKLKLKFEIDHAALAQAKISLNVPVSVSVADATTDELLGAVLGPAGLEFVRHDGDVRISPALQSPAAPAARVR